MIRTIFIARFRALTFLLSAAVLLLAPPISQVFAEVPLPAVPSLISPDLIVSPLERQAVDTVDKLSGSFRVTESGSANYKLDISLPKGTAGVTPDLFVQYDSSSGSGALGVGWSLGGVSEIRRCRQAIAQDGAAYPIDWSSRDRFCLNGQRLVLASTGQQYGAISATYHTEIDAHVIVKAHGGAFGHPDYFELYAKDGSVTRFGAAGVPPDNSEVRPTENGQTVNKVLAWAISEFHDSVGNRISYGYIADTNGQRLAEIAYAFGQTNQAGARLTFAYEDLLVPERGYLAGYQFNSRKRLKQIAVHNSIDGFEAALFQYNFDYHVAGVDRLRRIQKCFVSSGECTYPVEFEWNEFESHFSPTAQRQSLSSQSDRYVAGYKIGDINGDGRKDLVWQEPDLDNGRVHDTYYHVLLGSSDGLGEHYIAYSHSGNMNTPESWDLLDYNGDGRSDLIINKSGDWRTWVAARNSNGKWYFNGGINTNLSGNTVSFGDLNGDGLSDAVVTSLEDGSVRMHYLEKSATTSSYQYQLQNELSITVNGDAPLASLDSFLGLDIDGSGLTDALVRYSEVTFNEPLCNHQNVKPSCEDKSLLIRNGRRHYQLFHLINSGIPASVETEWHVTHSSPSLEKEHFDKELFAVSSLSNADVEELLEVYELAISRSNECKDATLTTPYVSCSIPKDDEVGQAAIGEIQSRLSTVRTQNGNSSIALFSLFLSHGDANGDGLADRFWLGSDLASSKPTMYYSFGKGDGEFSDIKSFQFNLDHLGEQEETITIAELEHRLSFQLVDVNLDGKKDIVFHDPGREGLFVHYMKQSNEEFDGTSNYLLATDGNVDNQHIILDMTGDGVPDYVRIEKSALQLNVGVSNTGLAANVMTSIKVEGGIESEIHYTRLNMGEHYFTYSPITQPNGESCDADLIGDFCHRFTLSTMAEFQQKVTSPNWDLPTGSHTFGKDRDRDGSPNAVFSINGSTLVVASIDSSAPAVSGGSAVVDDDAKSRISYYYGGLMIQPSGPGALGFERIMSIDEQSGIATTTAYRQDFPFTGLPYETRTKASDGRILSNSFNEWKLFGWSGNYSGDVPSYIGTSYYPYLAKTTEDTYKPVLLFSQFYSRTVTEIDVDSAGNVTQIDRLVTGNENEYRTTTQNEYDPAGFSLSEAMRLGRLSKSIVTKTRQENGVLKSSTRTAQFTYFNSGSNAGLLASEISEPDNTQLRVEKNYGYDFFGNQVRQRTVTQDGIRCDVDRVKFDTSGRYKEQEYDCLGRKQSDVLERNVYGNPTVMRQYLSASGNDYRDARYYYTAGNTKYFQTSEDGSWQANLQGACEEVAFCPAGAVIFTEVRESGGAIAREFIDRLGRIIRSSKLGFDGNWVQSEARYNSSGLQVLQSQPYYDHESIIHWSRTDYDMLGRPSRILAPNGGITKITYDTYKEFRLNSKNQEITKTVNVLGETVQVEDELGAIIDYRYDSRGNLSETEDSSGNVIAIHYDALDRKISMQDPDRGEWQYRYNSFGELIEQANANGQRSVISYDELGRKIRRQDYLVSGSLEGTTVWHYDIASYGLNQLADTQYTLASVASPTYIKIFAYDSLGRLNETVTSLGENAVYGNYYEKVTYDEFGRIYQTFDAARTGNIYDNNGVETRYNEFGYANQWVDAVYENGSTRKIYNTIQSLNPLGEIEQELLGNGVKRSVTYDMHNGLPLTLSSVTGGGAEIQHTQLQWDVLNNLLSRDEQGTLDGSTGRNVSINYQYDSLNRLTNTQGDRKLIYGDGSEQSVQLSQTLEYDLLGNITQKSDVGSYTYGAGSPHAVSQAGGIQYSYDSNGNMVSDTRGRQITYTSFDKVSEITQGGNRISYLYGSKRQRVLRFDVEQRGSNVINTQTIYVGSVEGVFRSTGEREWRRHIGQGLIITQVLDANDQVTESSEQYLIKDHLGSIELVTDSDGAVKQWFQYDAWGKRELTYDIGPVPQVGGSSGLLDGLGGLGGLLGGLGLGGLLGGDSAEPVESEDAADRYTRRGFTGHEHITSMGIINMNGRIYDPVLARFLQADTLVDGASFTQGYNRYSYARNNPLNATDPNGYSAYSLGAMGFAVLGGFFQFFVGSVFAIGAFFSTVATGGTWLSGLQNGAAAFVGGVAIGGLQSAKFIGQGRLSDVVKVITIGAIRGITSVLSGGRFGHGFVAAGTGATSNYLGDAESGKLANQKILVNTVAGGTDSNSTGGKFANGAATAAFESIVSEGRSSLSQEKGGGVELYGAGESTEYSYDERMKLKSALNVQADELEAVISSAQAGDPEALGKIHQWYGKNANLDELSARFSRITGAARSYKSWSIRKLTASDPNYGSSATTRAYHVFERRISRIYLSKTAYNDIISGSSGRYTLLHEVAHSVNFSHNYDKRSYHFQQLLCGGRC